MAYTWLIYDAYMPLSWTWNKPMYFMYEQTTTFANNAVKQIHHIKKEAMKGLFFNIKTDYQLFK